MTESGDENSDPGGEGASGAGTSAGEYAAGALGGLLVLLLIAFLGYQALIVRETGPALSVTVTGIEESGNGYAVHFDAVNTGGTTAQAVQIHGVLEQEGQETEQSTATIGYLPAESRGSGALLFSSDPRNGILDIRPTGYLLP
jgi:uncharacterized protein (TIGR02588 family)